MVQLVDKKPGFSSKITIYRRKLINLTFMKNVYVVLPLFFWVPDHILKFPRDGTGKNVLYLTRRL